MKNFFFFQSGTVLTANISHNANKLLVNLHVLFLCCICYLVLTCANCGFFLTAVQVKKITTKFIFTVEYLENLLAKGLWTVTWSKWVLYGCSYFSPCSLQPFLSIISVFNRFPQLLLSVFQRMKLGICGLSAFPKADTDSTTATPCMDSTWHIPFFFCCVLYRQSVGLYQCHLTKQQSPKIKNYRPQNHLVLILELLCVVTQECLLVCF